MAEPLDAQLVINDLAAKLAQAEVRNSVLEGRLSTLLKKNLELAQALSDVHDAEAADAPEEGPHLEVVPDVGGEDA